jgi:hypothetical protein
MASVLAGALLGLAIGSAFGAAPLLVGAVEDRLGLGVVGFVACALVGAGWSALAAPPPAGWRRCCWLRSSAAS